MRPLTGNLVVVETQMGMAVTSSCGYSAKKNPLLRESVSA
jgi:hypothetical protein